jgi:hypothetical protein
MIYSNHSLVIKLKPKYNNSLLSRNNLDKIINGLGNKVLIILYEIAVLVLL